VWYLWQRTGVSHRWTHGRTFQSPQSHGCLHYLLNAQCQQQHQKALGSWWSGLGSQGHLCHWPTQLCLAGKSRWLESIFFEARGKQIKWQWEEELFKCTDQRSPSWRDWEVSGSPTQGSGISQPCPFPHCPQRPLKAQLWHLWRSLDWFSSHASKDHQIHKEDNFFSFKGSLHMSPMGCKPVLM
jgi:hypothetical protein